MRVFSSLIIFLLLNVSSTAVFAQSMILSTSNEDFEVTNVFSDVDEFEFSIEIDAPLAIGVFENPPIVNVTYRVFGSLVAGTPSGFPAFELIREISGEEFYAQGSSLQFEIAATAVLDDGVQIAELDGGELVFQFNGREIDTGRFHPALFELNADGTGRIQNSNNVPTQEPLLEVEMGSEYINDLIFDPGNTTLITGTVVNTVPPEGGPIDVESNTDVNGGGGHTSLAEIFVLLLLSLMMFALSARPNHQTTKRLFSFNVTSSSGS